MSDQINPSIKFRIYHNLFINEINKKIILPTSDKYKDHLAFLERMRDPVYMIINNIKHIDLNDKTPETKEQQAYLSKLINFQLTLEQAQEIEQNYQDKVNEAVRNLDEIQLKKVHQMLDMSQKDITEKIQNDIEVKEGFSELANMLYHDYTLSPKVTANPFEVSKEVFQAFADKYIEFSKELYKFN